MANFGFLNKGGNLFNLPTDVEGLSPVLTPKSAQSALDTWTVEEMQLDELTGANIQNQKVEKAKFTSNVTEDVFTNTYTEIDLTNKDYYGIENPHIGYAWIRIPDRNLFTEGSGAASVEGNSNIIKNFLASNTGYIETRPSHFKKLRFQRFTQGIGNFELTLFDHNFQDLEKKLIQSRGSFIFKYGYTTNEKKASPWIIARAFTFNIQFGLEGITLNLTGMAVGHELATKILWKADFKTNTPISGVVEMIAKEAGFDTVIEPTVMISTRNGMETIDIRHIELPRLGGETTQEYIVNKLLPYAQNSEGDSRYVFYIETAGEKPVLHFHTLGYLDTKTGSNFKIPTFTMYKNPMSPILDFQPNWNRSLIDLAGAAGTYSPIFNLREQTVEQIYRRSDTTPYAQTTSVDNDTGCFMNLPNMLMSNSAAVKIRTESEAQKKSALTISAILRVVGSPKFKLCSPISVLVYLPRQLATGNVNSATQIHDVSGLFKIIGITDIMENGQYITELSLATEGKQLLQKDNPAWLTPTAPTIPGNLSLNPGGS